MSTGHKYTRVASGVSSIVPLPPTEPAYKLSSETTNLFSAVEPCIIAELPLPGGSGIPPLSYPPDLPAIRFTARAASANKYEESRGRAGFEVFSFGGGLSW